MRWVLMRDMGQLEFVCKVTFCFLFLPSVFIWVNCVAEKPFKQIAKFRDVPSQRLRCFYAALLVLYQPPPRSNSSTYPKVALFALQTTVLIYWKLMFLLAVFPCG